MEIPAPTSSGWTLLSFLRYASCPMCNLRVRELDLAAPALAEHGVRVVAVMHSSVERIKRHAGKRPLAISLVADPGRHLYATYGAESSWLGMATSMLRPSFYGAFAKAAALGYWGGAVDVDFASMPAEFLLTPGGRVALARYGRHIGDHLPLGDVRAALSTNSA